MSSVDAKLTHKEAQKSYYKNVTIITTGDTMEDYAYFSRQESRGNLISQNHNFRFNNFFLIPYWNMNQMVGKIRGRFLYHRIKSTRSFLT